MLSQHFNIKVYTLYAHSEFCTKWCSITKPNYRGVKHYKSTEIIMKDLKNWISCHQPHEMSFHGKALPLMSLSRSPSVTAVKHTSTTSISTGTECMSGSALPWTNLVIPMRREKKRGEKSFTKSKGISKTSEEEQVIGVTVPIHPLSPCSHFNMPLWTQGVHTIVDAAQRSIPTLQLLGVQSCFLQYHFF